MQIESTRKILPSQKTKIVCTLGPASRKVSTLTAMAHQGMTIARLNFSHGTPEEHEQDINNIRMVSEKTGKLIPIMIDLPGAKIRIGQLKEEPLYLKTGASITLTTENILGTSTIIPVDFPDLPKSVSKKSRIFLNDGFIELQVEEIQGEHIQCKILMGGPLLSRKGVNLPGAKLTIDPVRQQDLDIVQYGLDHHISIFSVSFVEKKQDIEKIKSFATSQGKDIFVVAKIERDEAIHHFEDILSVADGVMVARGDLGMEIPIEDVPSRQKQLIRIANQQGKPIITATQMLKSMTENSRPTRAEVADVANAIYDGTDAVMLSEETAIGTYPIEAVRMMASIAHSSEEKQERSRWCSELRTHFFNQQQSPVEVSDVLSFAVNETEQLLHPKYILVTTASGNTARRISRFKPQSWILAFSRNPETCEFLPFSYGVHPFHMNNPATSWHRPILSFIKENQLVTKDDIVLLTQRRFAEEKGGTDSLGVIVIDEEMH